MGVFPGADFFKSYSEGMNILKRVQTWKTSFVPRTLETFRNECFTSLQYHIETFSRALRQYRFSLEHTYGEKSFDCENVSFGARDIVSKLVESGFLFLE